MQARRTIEDLVRRYIDRVWNGADDAAIDELTSPGFRYYLGMQPPRDRAALAEFITSTREAFPDWRVEIVQLVADEHGAAVRWQGRVTHRGVFHGIPPTRQVITVTGINMYAVEGDRIAEEWEQTDSLAMLQQLGALPG